MNRIIILTIEHEACFKLPVSGLFVTHLQSVWCEEQFEIIKELQIMV